MVLVDCRSAPFVVINASIRVDFAIIIACNNVVFPLFYKFEAPDSDSWFDMFVESLQDTTVIVLIVAALVSLVVGTLDDPKKG